MRRILFATAAAASGSSIALAADSAAPGYKVPISAPPENGTGFYAGLYAGSAFGHLSEAQSLSARAYDLTVTSENFFDAVSGPGSIHPEHDGTIGRLYRAPLRQAKISGVLRDDERKPATASATERQSRSRIGRDDSRQFGNNLEKPRFKTG